MNLLERFWSVLGFRNSTPKLGTDMMSVLQADEGNRQALLAEINADIPFGVDWVVGAQRYVEAEINKHGREPYTHYLLTKPFGQISPGEAGRAGRLENLHYLYNFTNAFGLLDLPGGTAVLDVACGSGWVSQFFARMGYEVHGFDLCIDMVDLTRQRLRQDAQLGALHPLLESRFFQLDIERQALPETLTGYLARSC